MAVIFEFHLPVLDRQRLECVNRRADPARVVLLGALERHLGYSGTVKMLTPLAIPIKTPAKDKGECSRTTAPAARALELVTPRGLPPPSSVCRPGSQGRPATPSNQVMSGSREAERRPAFGCPFTAFHCLSTVLSRSFTAFHGSFAVLLLPFTVLSLAFTTYHQGSAAESPTLQLRVALHLPDPVDLHRRVLIELRHRRQRQ